MEIQWSQTSPTLMPNLQQCAAYAGAALRSGVKGQWAEWWDGAQPLGHALVLDRPGLRLVSRGPVWLDAVPRDMRVRGLRLLARRRAVTIVTPAEPIAGFGLVPIITPQTHAIWDLRPDTAALRAGLSGKWRNRLVAAETAGLRVRAGTAATLDRLISAEAQQRHTRRYHALPGDFAKAMPPEHLSLWQWMSGGRMQAAMCFVRHGAGATYLMGWSDPEARGRNCHNLMLWTAALSLRSQGVQSLDLGAVNDEDAPGLAHFKRGTGAALHRAGATCLVLPL